MMMIMITIEGEGKLLVVKSGLYVSNFNNSQCFMRAKKPNTVGENTSIVTINCLQEVTTGPIKHI